MGSRNGFSAKCQCRRAVHPGAELFHVGPDRASGKQHHDQQETQEWNHVTTALGVQSCDQAGRVNGIISKPQNKWLSNAAFGATSPW
jgi:hypothetical protein